MNALSRAFSLRSRQTELSHNTHKLALGIFALREATDRGGPLAPALQVSD